MTLRAWSRGVALATISGLLLQGSLLAQKTSPSVALESVRTWSFDGVTRIALELSGPAKWRGERALDPPRLFFDLQNCRIRLKDKGSRDITVNDSVVKKIRLALNKPTVARVVLDLQRDVDYQVSALTHPTRLVIELRPKKGATSTAPELTAAPVPPPAPVASASNDRKKNAASKDAARAGNESASRPPVEQAAVQDRPPEKDEDAPEAIKNASTAPQYQWVDIPVDRPVKPSVEANPVSASSGADSVTAPVRKLETANSKPSGVATAANSRGTNRTTAANTSLTKTTKGRGASSAKTAAATVTPPVVEMPKNAPPPDPSPGPVAPVDLASTPRPAKSNANGDRSLTRALGLKLSRIVIDAGHGGHDLGTTGVTGLNEKDLVLDVSKRLGALVQSRLGAEVVYTRPDDTFIALEERTAIANRSRADLFLSIHANSSPVASVSGPEVYYLSLTRVKSELDTAARENAGTGRSVFELSELVKKITLNDKLQESSEFASIVDGALARTIQKTNKNAKDRGVKKAPFVVLIGASMPSVLAEIGFVSNPREEALLKKADYRQKIAEALYQGVERYASTLSQVSLAQGTSHQ